MRAPRLTVDDLVAAFPAVIGHQPSDGDVGFALVTANREVRYWRNLDERTYGTARLKAAYRDSTTNVRAAVIESDWTRLGARGAVLLVGYGPQGVTNAAHLRDQLTAWAIPVEACAVVGNSWGDLIPGRDRIDPWYALPDEPAWLTEYLHTGVVSEPPGAPKPPGPDPEPPTTPHPHGPGL